jgi:hypothetical protein
MKGIWSSRKFWALLAATVAIVGSVATQEVTWLQGLQTFIAAIGAFIVGTGISDAGGK